MAEVGVAALGGDNPRTVRPGRVMANMLGVATLEVGDPVAVIVLMKADDFTLRHIP